ncbi:hypothetical protein Tco_0407263 [Tanacetum coccineum]
MLVHTIPASNLLSISDECEIRIGMQIYRWRTYTTILVLAFSLPLPMMLILVILGDLTSPVQTRGTLKKSKFGKSTFVSYVHDQQRNNHTDYLHCLFACFLSQLEPSSVALALNGPDGFEAMKRRLQQFIIKSLLKALYGLIKHQGQWVYVDDIIFGSTKKVWCDEFVGLMKVNLLVVQDMLKKFDMESVRTATTPYEASKPKSKDEPDDAVNVHLYRSMIGSSCFSTASRPDIMFAVSACSRHQVTPLSSNLNAVKKIFKYLKGQPKLGKSTTGGCQFLGRRLISWQCKKQTIVATSSTEAEYVAAANCCGQLVNATLGSDSQIEVEAAVTLSQASRDAQLRSDGTPERSYQRTDLRRRLRKQSNIPAFEKFQAQVAAIGTSIPADGVPAVSSIPADGVPAVSIPAGSLNVSAVSSSDKGKAPVGDETSKADLLSAQERVLKNLHDAMLGEALARKVQAEEEANLARHREELAKKAQADPEGSFAQGSSLPIATHTKLSRRLLGDDVPEETFSERLADLMRRKRQAIAERITKEKRDRPMTQGQQREFMRNFVKNQSCSLYQTGWSMAKVTKFTNAQLKEEFEKIQRTLKRAKILDFKRSLPRSQPALEEPSSKKIRRNEDVPAGGFSPDLAVQATQGESLSHSATNVDATNVDYDPKVTTKSETYVSAVPTFIPTVVAAGAPLVASIPNTKRRKRTARKRAPLPLLDMDDQSFLKFDSGSESEGELVAWAKLAAWEVVSTPLGEVNALYRVDRFTKYFTHLREILHLVTRQDLIHLYHLVDKFYETNVATGVGLLLWGDLKVLFDSTEGGAGYSIWGGQQNWQIRSWRLYTFPHIHVLETMAGQVMYMFVDVPYPLSIKLMERMLKHKLELARDVVGNDLTTAEQLISFIKSQLVAAQASAS